MLGLCLIFIGETGPVDAIVDEAARALRVTGDLWGQAQLLSLEAERARRVHGNFAEAKALDEAGLRVARQLGNPWVAGITIFSQALASASDGDHAAAHASFEEAEAHFAQLGDRHFINAIRSERGHIERSLGHHAQALAYYALALPGWQEMGARPAAAHDLECIAFIACERSQPVLAVRLLAAADSVRAATDAPMASFERDEYDRVLASLRAELTPEAFAAAWDEGSSMTKDEAVAAGLEAAQQLA
jgi:hypothetical protein